VQEADCGDTRQHRKLAAAHLGDEQRAEGHAEPRAYRAAGEPEPLARAIARLLEDAPLRRRIGDAGLGLVEARYSGARLAGHLIALYRSRSCPTRS